MAVPIVDEIGVSPWKLHLAGSHCGGVANNKVLIFAQASAGRNQVTHDDVLLHALQGVALGVDSGLGKHLGGLLEGGGRDERLGLQRGAGDALEHLTAGGGVCVAYGDKLLVLTAQ